jgi:hypothetical protein
MWQIGAQHSKTAAHMHLHAADVVLSLRCENHWLLIQQLWAPVLCYLVQRLAMSILWGKQTLLMLS